MAALFDFLKKKEEAEKAKKPASAKATAGKAGKKAEKPLATKKAEKRASTTDQSVVPPKTAAKRTVKGFSFEAVSEPHISEKSTYLSEKNQYIFKVLPGYNKNEIKKTVEGIYGVNVLSVNLVKIPAKKRRLGKTQGFRKSYKKAIVKIREGQKIEIL